MCMSYLCLFVMWQVFACFKSAKDLKACGFHIELGHSSEKEYGLDPTSELYVAQQNLAKVMWQAALQIVRFRSISHMHYIGQAPTCFVELLSTGDKLVVAGWWRQVGGGGPCARRAGAAVPL